jgi:hypothetical protein
MVKLNGNKILDYLVKKRYRVLVAHTCNPSYSVDSDQEEHRSKPARANSSQDPISSKEPITKIGLVEQLKV